MDVTYGTRGREVWDMKYGTRGREEWYTGTRLNFAVLSMLWAKIHGFFLFSKCVNFPAFSPSLPNSLPNVTASPGLLIYHGTLSWRFPVY